MIRETEGIKMSKFDFDVNKQNGLPQLPDNYWKNQKKTEDFSDVNTIFDKNLNASLKDISIFERKTKE